MSSSECVHGIECPASAIILDSTFGKLLITSLDVSSGTNLSFPPVITSVGHSI